MGTSCSTSEGEEFEADCVILATGAVPAQARHPGRGRVHRPRRLVVRHLRRRRCTRTRSSPSSAAATRRSKRRCSSPSSRPRSTSSTAATSSAPRSASRSAAKPTPRSRSTFHASPSRSSARTARSPASGSSRPTESPRSCCRVDGVFIFVGVHPVSELVARAGRALTDNGYIKIDHDGRTSCPACSRPAT